MASALTIKWLQRAVEPYPRAEELMEHLLAVIAARPALRPKSDVYTFDDGRTQLLLCLHGLLPITYRAADYNIPVALWFPRDYPIQPPIVYVVPTDDILVRPGRCVDPSGRCAIDYLHHWQRKHEGFTLPALLDALQDHFSSEPPVYSKPKQLTYAHRPPPPLPPPPVTHAAQPPPLPPHPQLSALFPGHAYSPPSAPNERPIPPPFVSPSLLPPEQFHPVLSHPVPDLLDQQDDSPSLPGPMPSFPPPPPRPPNPELLRIQSAVHRKFSSEFDSLSKALAIDAERLRAQQADLLAGEPAIKDEMARLEAVRDVCRSVANRTRQAVQHVESNISQLRKKGDPEVDELVCATSIVHNQLLNLIADDNAIEDTIYHLHRALNSGRIDLERFLRSTRVLAEEQFMKRALIEKIQTTMPSFSIAPDWA